MISATLIIYRLRRPESVDNCLIQWISNHRDLGVGSEFLLEVVEQAFLKYFWTREYHEGDRVRRIVQPGLSFLLVIVPANLGRKVLRMIIYKELLTINLGQIYLRTRNGWNSIPWSKKTFWKTVLISERAPLTPFPAFVWSAVAFMVIPQRPKLICFIVSF